VAPAQPPSFFTDKAFSELPISDATKQALEKLNFTKMTHIQSLSIPPLLTGQDVVGAAKTGSGKTLVRTSMICSPSWSMSRRRWWQSWMSSGDSPRALCMGIFYAVEHSVVQA
jgi:hypothetical protein